MPAGSQTNVATQGEAPRKIAPLTYVDFVVQLRRKSPKLVDVLVYASPAGAMTKPVSVAFSAAEADEIRDSFCADPATGNTGRRGISAEEAAVIGKRLAPLLFPVPVYALFGQCLGSSGSGLRIRLALDESLMDLPWEYCYRPDRLASDGISGFLLLDPQISLVREAANPRISLDPIAGKQRMAFVGTLWQGNVDGWEVRKEFDLLRQALKPVASYMAPAFATAASEDAFSANLQRGAAIFHYAGHCDFDADGRAFLVREFPGWGSLQKSHKLYLDDLARVLTKAKPRLAVMSGCNSGCWRAAKPLLAAEIPALIGVNGVVASQSTIEFCAKLYESLAVGLTLDEAVGRARLHVLTWGHRLGRFDWGLYMVYMPSPQAVLFERRQDKALAARQTEARHDHKVSCESAIQMARDMDGPNYGDIMSEMKKNRVLILGRFSARRMRVLKAIKDRLKAHPNRYNPELFTFSRPDGANLTESIIGFAAHSRFVVADISEPKSIPAELSAIVPLFPSLPVVPIISRTGRPYALFTDFDQRPNMVKPILRYRDVDELEALLEREIVPLAEKKLAEIRPSA